MQGTSFHIKARETVDGLKDRLATRREERIVGKKALDRGVEWTEMGSADGSALGRGKKK